MTDQPTFTAFCDHSLIAAGALGDVARALVARDDDRPIQIFEDITGSRVELDLRKGPDQAVAEYLARSSPQGPPTTRPGRGRPKLGVVAREVTLLPRHWDWLATQPGGASAALRRLVEEARRASEGPDRARRAQEAAYRVMSALAGDFPAFEEASRALFAGDHARLRDLTSSWHADVRSFVLRLAISG